MNRNPKFAEQRLMKAKVSGPADDGRPDFFSKNALI